MRFLLIIGIASLLSYILAHLAVRGIYLVAKIAPTLKSIKRSQSQPILILIPPLILLLFHIITTFIIGYIYGNIVSNSLMYPRIFANSESIRSIIYYAFSLLLGISLAILWHIISFNLGYARSKIVNNIWIISFIFISMVEALGLIDKFFHRRIFSFTAFIPSFVITYLTFIKMEYHNIKSSVNFTDLGALLYIDNMYKENNTVQSNVCKDLKKGKVYKAFIRLNFYLLLNKIIRRQFKPDKQLLKLKAMTYYRLRQYPKVLEVAVEGNKLLGSEDFSQTLLGFQALAKLNMRQIPEAIDILEKAYSKRSQGVEKEAMFSRARKDQVDVH